MTAKNVGQAGEFDLIERHFKQPAVALAAQQPGVHLGIGDDCALLAPTPGHQWAVTSDMLVAGRHFFDDVDPEALGHKALAVNLSDLAACGAKPVAFTLALALPTGDDAWLAAFSRGLLALASAHGCALVGGDTTRGPLNICITAMGEVPAGQSLRRDGARVGDDVYVSGHLGDARLALDVRLGQLDAALFDAASLRATNERLDRPTPRVSLGLALRGIATSVVDVSDGLVGDLGHILKASNVGATLRAKIAMKMIAIFALQPGLHERLGDAVALRAALAGGDDYELCFTAPPTARDAVAQAAQQTGVAVTCIGQIDAAPGLRVVDESGTLLPASWASFDHFA